MFLSKPKVLLVTALLVAGGLQAEDVDKPGGAGQLLQYEDRVGTASNRKELGDPADSAQSAASGAERVDLEKAVRSVIDAEIAYDKLAAEKNFAAASVEVFADDGVAFAPGPVNGKKFWGAATESPILTWKPIFATISRAADLGFTTGPWELRKQGEDPKPAAFGHYNTMWRKNKAGVWKVVVDVGITHPPPAEPPGEVETFVPDFPVASPESIRKKLEDADKSFAELLLKDAGAAVLAMAGDGVRVYRDGSAPAAGKTAARLMLGADHGKTKRTRAGGGVSRSDDLAYSYGEYTTERTNVTERGIYFSIWQLDLASDWKLILDLQKKAPEKKP